MIIAIDHGNYAIKTLNHSFVAGLSEHTVKPPMTDEIMEYDGRFWTLTGNRLSYMRDKTQDERYFILTLFAIAKELESAGTPLQEWLFSALFQAGDECGHRWCSEVRCKIRLSRYPERLSVY